MTRWGKVLSAAIVGGATLTGAASAQEETDPLMLTQDELATVELAKEFHQCMFDKLRMVTREEFDAEVQKRLEGLRDLIKRDYPDASDQDIQDYMRRLNAQSLGESAIRKGFEMGATQVCLRELGTSEYEMAQQVMKLGNLADKYGKDALEEQFGLDSLPEPSLRF
ncbi:MAG: hypothetical protein H6867_06670 [Rhodospirillales bacterium]|nr:hypothetical protein [Rhodospirillales bacterium]MCB9995232.1 hypothetical protein [Rhodospirillales bacterium]